MAVSFYPFFQAVSIRGGVQIAPLLWVCGKLANFGWLEESIPKVIGGGGRFSLFPWGILFLQHLPVVFGFPEVVGEGGDGIGNRPADDVFALSVLGNQ
jgi:hypothetical protein